MAKPIHKAKRGTVSISSRSGMLRLRWRYQGQQYQMALGMSDTAEHRHAAQGKASEIQADIIYGRFDASLDRYRATETPKPTKPASTVALFERIIEHRRQEGTSGQAIAARYRPMRSNLQRFDQNITTTDTAREFMELLKTRQAPRTLNQSLTMLKSFGRWAVTDGYFAENPYSSIKPIKGAVPVQNRRPFTRDEVKAFLNALSKNQRLCWYTDLCLVMFSLGLRPSEAIGLRWQHLDLARAEVTICESLSRSAEGKTAGYARERRPTKTHQTRILPLSDRLVELFNQRRPEQTKPDDLVFTSPRGNAIDDHNFCQRVWKATCKAAGIEYRPPYTSRHTHISHGIEYEGWSLPQAARVAGHTSTRMVAETYGHMINRPKLPEF
ncbi:MAG: tyrosine-type recombinase/integrase [Leptolyngbyaceae cyanobacterium]